MLGRLHCQILFLCVCLAAAGLLRAEEPGKAGPKPGEAAKQARTDLFGDPLPEGAIARLGSVRWRADGSLTSLRYSSDGKTLLLFGGIPGDIVAFTQTRILHILDASNGKSLRRLTATLTASILRGGEHVDPARWAISPNSQFLARRGSTAQGIRGILVQELATGRTIFEIGDDRSHFTYLRFTPDSRLLAAVGTRLKEDYLPVAIRLWDVAACKEVGTLAGEAGKDAFRPLLFTISADGRFLAASGSEADQKCVVRVWDLPGRKFLWKEAEKTESFPFALAVAPPLAFSPDGKWIAMVRGNRLQLREAATGKLLRTLTDFPGLCSGLVFTPDGKRLAVDFRGKLRLWQTAGGDVLVLPDREVNAFVFAPDGQTLAVLSQGASCV